MNYYGGSNQEIRMQKDKLRSLRKALLYSYQSVTIALPDEEGNFSEESQKFRALINPDKNKLEYWQYIPPICFNINPNEGFEFAEKLFNTTDIWNLFLSGSARMDFYQGEKVSLEQRIKYAIVEYMIRRPQFYTTDDFVDNPILHKKYKKKEG